MGMNMMKYIKLALISLVFFAVLVTLISFFFPSQVRISKAIDITTSRDTLLSRLGDPAKWSDWYPGADTMHVMKLMGRTLGLKLDESGGLIRVMEKTDSTVTVSAAGAHMREMNGGWNIFPATIPNTFTVQWYMDFHLEWYPWEKFSSITFEKRYGPIMEKGLENLKRVVER
jgi:hypothetical protein